MLVSGMHMSMSTVYNIYILQSVIDVAFNRGKKVFCASIDFSKACDYINRNCLWYKLLKSGIRGNISNIIKSMYMNTFSKVKYQGAMSDQFECNIGVRQGESILPFLLNIFSNDLDSALALGGFQGITEGAFNLRSFMHADDVLLLSNSREYLQAGLDCFYDYCLKWKLNVNTTKTSIIIFRKGGTTSLDDHFFFGDKLLTISNSLYYLGLVLSCSGKFSQTHTNLADQGLRRYINYLMTLMNYMFQTSIFSVACLLNLYSQ